jgi:hypothetical protein
MHARLTDQFPPLSRLGSPDTSQIELDTDTNMNSLPGPFSSLTGSRSMNPYETPKGCDSAVCLSLLTGKGRTGR